MSSRPFMQLYVSDFVGDTLQLSTEQIGAYLLLLIALWNANGSIPADEVKLARIARMTVKKWKTVSVEVMPFFEVEDNRLSHDRLTKELQKSERQSELRAAAGALGGAAKSLNGKRSTLAKDVAMLQHASALPKPYKKEGGNLSLKKGGKRETLENGKVKVHRDEAVFSEIVRTKGKSPFTNKDGYAYVEPDLVFELERGMK